MQVFCASGVEEVSVGGRSYRIGADGAFEIDNESDVKQLAELGHAHRARPVPVPCAGCIAMQARLDEADARAQMLESQLAAKQSKRK